MYEATLVMKGDNVSITVEDGDDKTSPTHLIPMTTEDAKLLRLWLNGMSNSKGPIEVRVGKHTYWLDHEIWFPMRAILNHWYEVYHAS